MTADHVVTRPNRGQWENVVDGRPELSMSFRTREEAVDQGRRLADELAMPHDVVNDEQTAHPPTNETLS